MSWDPINLANLEDRPAIRPDLGDVGIVYPGKRHVFSGPPESAKTLAAYAIGLAVVRQGGNVLLIDFEMGPYDARDRLRELGATDDELSRVLYVEPESAATPEVIDELLDRWTFDLVIIDAAAGAYGLQGLDDNARKDVEQFAGLYVQRFWLRGIASIVIDHVTKNADKRGAFVIGSERKVGGADVHLGFTTVLPLIRGGRGLFKITTHKDRLGYLERPKAGELEVVSDALTHALTANLRPTEKPLTDTPWQPTILMERVSRYLELRSAADAAEVAAVTQSELRENVQGRDSYVDRAAAALVVEGYLVESQGPRGSRVFSLVRPYRQTTSAPPRPHIGGPTSLDPSGDLGPASPPLGDAEVAEVESGAAENDSGWLYLIDETSSPLVTHARRDCPEIPPVAVLCSVLIPFGSGPPTSWLRCERCGGARLIGEDDW